jgi:hypothetical protein
VAFLERNQRAFWGPIVCDGYANDIASARPGLAVIPIEDASLAQPAAPASGESADAGEQPDGPPSMANLISPSIQA